MSIYIGGAETQLEYDFGLKVANSTSECPMKIYKQEVNPDSLPSPTTTYTNLISNGDFSNGVTGWNRGTASNNTLTLLVTAQYQSSSQSLNSIASSVSGHKLYYCATIKADSTSVNIKLVDNSNYNNKNISSTGNYVLVSNIATIVSNNTTLAFNIQDDRPSGWTNIYAKNILVVDLTATFGAGNEPTQTWCDTYLPFVLSTGTCPTGWTEITSQTMLDKLKTQNELPVTAIASDKSTVTWNSKTLPKTSTLKVLDDFVGKVNGSIVENPHIAKYIANTTLTLPSAFSSEISLSNYNNINVQGSGTYSYVASGVAGYSPQHLFSFNVIEQFERKYGAIPKETTAEKVDWLRNNLSLVTCNWTGYGSCPTGNKAYLTVLTSGAWNTSVSNTASSPTLTSYYGTSLTQFNGRLNSDGFMHFLSYTDSARTTDSTLLVLTGHGLSNNDVIENLTRGVITSVTVGTNNTLTTSTTITNQTGGDSIDKFRITSTTKYAEAGTNETTIVLTNHGLSDTHAHYIKNASLSYAGRKVTVVDANTLSLSVALTGQTSGNNIFIYTYQGNQTAESTVIPSTIYTDYVSLELTLKAPESMITATNTLSDIVTDYTNKVSGSLTENANISKYTATSSLTSPSSFTSEFGVGYDNFKTLNGTCTNVPTSTNTYIPQHLFSFNVVSAVEKALGQSIPSTDKIQWCRDFVKSAVCDWYGYGSCPSGNSATFTMNLDKNGTWYTGIVSGASTPTIKTLTSSDTTSTTISNRICDDGYIHYLAYAPQSDGVTASTIYTDYIKLTIKLKYIPCYDFFTDSNTRRDAGLTDIVLVKRTIGDMLSDFTSKVSGSVVENPNIGKFCNNQTTLQSPSSSNFSENSQVNGYDKYKTLDGVCAVGTLTGNGLIAQQLFQFNLIEIAQRALGTSIPGADTASKVQWLKDNIANIVVDWHGYGSCPSGNKAILRIWYTTNNEWHTTIAPYHTSGSVTKLTISQDTTQIPNRIDSSGIVNILAYTDASDGNTASVINTDYVKLTLTFKSDTVGYEYFTNNSAEVSVTTNNKSSAYLIECDLTPIATALYGGSNSALKSALKSITADVYAMGSGSNVNQLGYGFDFGYFNATNPSNNWSTSLGYSPWQGKSTTSTVTKITSSLVSADITWGGTITSSNKFYIIIKSLYKSDGAIASEVNLDYVNIKVALNRTPDVISNPPTINLTNTWSMLVRGFSPSWDSTETNAHYLVSMSRDDNNKHVLFWSTSNLKWAFQKKYNGVWGGGLLTNAETFSKYQIVNLLISQKSDGMYFQYLFNNKTFVSKKNTDANFITGTTTLQPMVYFDYSTAKADAFLDNIVYLPNQVFDDTTAEAILRGTQSGYEFPELFDINSMTLFYNATRSNGVVSVTNTTNYNNYAELKIPILPNNQYELKCTKTNGYMEVSDYYNNIRVTARDSVCYGTGTFAYTFTTGSKANYLYIKLKSYTTGSDLSLSNVSLKLKM